jgi:hypothetical protein
MLQWLPPSKEKLNIQFVRRDKDKKLKLTMRLINCALGHEDL